MLTFLTVAYVLILFALTKTGKVPNNSTTWLTIIPYELILIIGFFIPMQWGAPAGDVRTMAYSIPITPNVTGEVLEVPVESDAVVKEGDVLFTIEPTPYRAALEGLKAQLVLAETRLEQSQALVDQQAGSVYELQAYQAQVDGLRAQILNAEYNLEETVVRAPSDGLVTYVGLRPGSRVANLPLFKAMAFIDTSELLFGVQIPQNFSRNVEPGQMAEVTFEAHPGKVYPATVMYLVPATAQGQLVNTGMAAAAMDTARGPFFVRLKLDDESLAAELLPGSMGSAAIYTSKIESTHVIRKVMIRMDAIINYIDPGF
jgi:RND family efflux transporter MFP subunit